MEEYQILYIEKIAYFDTLRRFFNGDICDFVACQFAIESNFGRSNLAIEACNHSGMKVPHRRVCNNIGSYKGFSKYLNLCQCILDYILWVFYYRPSLDDLSCVSSFMKFLERKGYCPYYGYTQSIYLLYKKYKNECERDS